MNHVKLVKEFNLEYGSLYRAYIQALTPNEKCEYLFFELHKHGPKRKYLYRQIILSAENNYCESYSELVNKLLEGFINYDYQTKFVCARLLSGVYESASLEQQRKIIDKLIYSKYLPVRGMGYELMDRNWSNDFTPLILGRWEEIKDKGCAEVAAKRMDLDFVLNNFEKLCELLKSHKLTNLFERISKINPELLKKLNDYDDVTHAYILQKCGKELSSSEALEMFYRNKNDERIGLLVWCFGRMGLREVLKTIHDELVRNPEICRRLLR